MNTLVSFIIPYYNSIDAIEETIDSIMNQTYENFDIWIINDGSNQESFIKLDLLKKMKRILNIKNRIRTIF